MSQENVEVVRRLFRALNRTFSEGTRDLYDVLDPDVEFIPVTTILEGGPGYRGERGVRQWVKEMRRDWTAWELKPEQFRDLGGDRVLILGAWRAQSMRGEVPLEVPQAAWMVQVSGGRVSQMQAFTDRRKALEAAGLAE
jgi:ketosteroid isomerase-like protein